MLAAACTPAGARKSSACSLGRDAFRRWQGQTANLHRPGSRSTRSSASRSRSRRSRRPITRRGSTRSWPARDLPDIIAAVIFSTTMPNIGDFLNSACADLTPYLSGDAVKDYPNLANLPSTRLAVDGVQQQDHGRARRRRRGPRRRRCCSRAGATWTRPASPAIGSPDEFMGICKQLNNPGTRWALGANTLVNWLAMVYGGAQRLARVGWQVHQGLRDARVQRGGRLPPRPVGRGPVPSGFAHSVGQPGGRAVLRRQVRVLAARQLVAGRVSDRLGARQRRRSEFQAARGAAIQQGRQGARGAVHWHRRDGHHRAEEGLDRTASRSCSAS